MLNLKTAAGGLAGLCLAATMTTTIVVASGEAAHAAPQDEFQMPFPCGETWQGATRAGHGTGNHYALDFNWGTGSDDYGREVVASAAGTAHRLYEAGGAGNYVRIDHGGGWSTFYMHLSGYEVTDGAAVEQGELIGRVGSTGASGGPHLHFEQRLNGISQYIHFDGAPLSPGYSYTYNGPSYTSKNCGGGQPDSSRPVRDYNGDGRGDLFARKPDGTYVFYRGYEGGKYGSATVMNGGWNNFNLVEGVGDANGDRRPDVVARSSAGDLYLYRGYEGGAFGSKALISGGWDNFNVIEGVGDVTGNGTQDLFVRRPDGTALLYRGDGHGKFNSPIEISGGWNIYNRIEGVGDVTGEGVPDLVARNAEGELYLYRGYRSGKFGTRTLISGGWNNFNLIEGVGDATGNGTADLFVRRPDGTALIYRGDGEGKFNNPITINGGWDNFNLITQ